MNKLRALLERLALRALSGLAKRIETLGFANARLSCELERYRQMVADMDAELARLNHLNTRARREQAAAQSQLAFFRCAQDSVAGRTGFAITVFVPDVVVKKLAANMDKLPAFKQEVIDMLMDRVLRGCTKVVAGKGVAAITFEPLTPDPKSERMVSYWHHVPEAGDKLRYNPMIPDTWGADDAPGGKDYKPTLPIFYKRELTDKSG